MQSFKKELTEEEAAHYAVQSVFQGIEKHWSSIKQKLSSQFEEAFLLQLPSFAPIDLAFAVIALDLQSLPNLFPKEQSDRIHKFVLSAVKSEKENGQYGCEETALYEKEFLECIENPRTEKYLYTEGNPILAISGRLVTRWMVIKSKEEKGSEELKSPLERVKSHLTKMPSPLLVMAVAELIMSLAGAWQIIHTEFKIKS